MMSELAMCQVGCPPPAYLAGESNSDRALSCIGAAPIAAASERSGGCTVGGIGSFGMRGADGGGATGQQQQQEQQQQQQQQCGGGPAPIKKPGIVGNQACFDDADVSTCGSLVIQQLTTPICL